VREEEEEEEEGAKYTTLPSSFVRGLKQILLFNPYDL
jgi:hypothetical protein